MEHAGENKDEERRRDALPQSGSGRDESQGIALAEHVADGEPSHADGNLSDAGAGMSTTEESARHLDERDVRYSARQEAVDGVDVNGIRAWDDPRDLQPKGYDLQSTFKLGDAVENDARAVARSLTALLGSLKSALSEVTGSSLEHMRAENEAAGQVQDVAIDAATKGNRFINSCLRLNEEMKGMNHLATQLESLKQRVDQFEFQSNRHLPRQ